MLMIVKLELGEHKRKVIVEHTEGDSVQWLVGYLRNDNDETGIQNRLKDFRDLYSVPFKEYEHAEIVFNNYMIEGVKDD